MELSKIKVPQNSKVIIGRPSVVPSEAILIAVKQVFERHSECTEAHLPQIFILGAMDLPRLALVLVCKEPSQFEEIASAGRRHLARYLPVDCSLDLWVIADTDPLLDSVKRAGCQIGKRTELLH